jgi:hypothetical protein
MAKTGLFIIGSLHGKMELKTPGPCDENAPADSGWPECEI